LKAADLQAEIINIGGGSPCAYASQNGILPLEEISEKTSPHVAALPYGPKIILEPEASLAGAGDCFVTV